MLLPAPPALLPDWNAITEIRIWTVSATRLPFREAAIKMELSSSSGTAPFPMERGNRKEAHRETTNQNYWSEESLTPHAFKSHIAEIKMNQVFSHIRP